jgi:RNA polymerase sigma-70 factor (ECF subfamily)
VRRIIPNLELADDVAQEALVLAYRALPRLRDRTKFAGWLLAIARHRAFRMLRAERPTLALDAVPDLVAPVPDSGTETLITAMAALPEDFRRPALLHYLEGWPVNRIAEVDGLTATTVKWRLHRAREILRRLER